MKLFAITAYGHYCKGAAVIRAESEEEAKQIAAKIRGSGVWNTNWGDPDSVEEISTTAADPVLFVFEYGE